MPLQGPMRGRQAPARWCLAAERQGASPEVWESPPGTAAPARPCLRCQPVEPTILHERCEEGLREASAAGPASVTEVTRSSPRCTAWGAAESGRGKARHPPPPACRLRLPCCTRDTAQGMPRHVDRRQGEPPDDLPRSRGGGGWGGGVGGRDSRLHGEADPRRRPLAVGKTGTTGRRERASCTGGKSRSLWMRRKGAGTLRALTERDCRC